MRAQLRTTHDGSPGLGRCWSNTCACLRHARGIWTRVGMGYTISIETSKRQNGGRFKEAHNSFRTGF